MFRLSATLTTYFYYIMKKCPINVSASTLSGHFDARFVRRKIAQVPADRPLETSRRTIRWCDGVYTNGVSGSARQSFRATKQLYTYAN